MPPAHLAHATNLTYRHSVGAGHARPATLSLHPFYLKTVGEGFIPPAHPTPSLTQRPTRRGAYMPPAHLIYIANLTLRHSVGVGVPDDPPRQFSAATLLRADASIRPYSL